MKLDYSYYAKLRVTENGTVAMPYMYFAKPLGNINLVNSTAGVLVAVIYGIFLKPLKKVQVGKNLMLISKGQLIVSDKEIKLD